MKRNVAYKYRFYPTSEQETLLLQTFGCCRVAYNMMLKLRTDGWHDGKRISYAQTSKELTKIKKLPEYRWLNDVSCVPLQQSLRHLQSAFERFFKKQTAYPTFKKKRGKQSAEFTKSAFKFDAGTRRLWLAKMAKPLKIKWSRKLSFEPITVTISKDPANRFFVSFQGETDIQPLPPSDTSVGIDFGISRFATLSTGKHIQKPRHLKKCLARLKMLQQRLARRKKGGQNWKKTKLQIAKIHAKIADCRNDFLHKFTTSLVRDFEHIITEDLHIRGMVRNHNLAQAISDVAWGEAMRQLDYKSEWYGRLRTEVDRFFPSSKRCHVCGHIVESLPLSVREWTCPSCETLHDRDDNASVNIQAVGLTASIYGLGVRRPKNLSSAHPSA